MSHIEGNYRVTLLQRAMSVIIRSEDFALLSCLQTTWHNPADAIGTIVSCKGLRMEYLVEYGIQPLFLPFTRS